MRLVETADRSESFKEGLVSFNVVSVEERVFPTDIMLDRKEDMPSQKYGSSSRSRIFTRGAPCLHLSICQTSFSLKPFGQSLRRRQGCAKW